MTTIRMTIHSDMRANQRIVRNASSSGYEDISTLPSLAAAPRRQLPRLQIRGAGQVPHHPFRMGRWRTEHGLHEDLPRYVTGPPRKGEVHLRRKDQPGALGM